MSTIPNCAVCARLEGDGRLLGDMVRWIESLCEVCFQRSTVSPLALTEAVHGTLPQERGYRIGLKVMVDTNAPDIKSSDWPISAIRFLHRLSVDVGRARLGHGFDDVPPVPATVDCNPLPAAGERRTLAMKRSNEERFRDVVPGLAFRSFSIEPIQGELSSGAIAWRLYFDVALFPRGSIDRVTKATVVVDSIAESDIQPPQKQRNEPLPTTVIEGTGRLSDGTDGH